MAINEGKSAHEHALNALNLLVTEYWTFETLGLVRQQLGQAYYNLKKHLKAGHCVCGDKPQDLEFYKSVLVDVNTAISTASIQVVPVLQEELTSYFSCRKECHRCIKSITCKAETAL